MSRDEEGRSRVRLRPRQGAQHRFGFARRWEARRRSQGSSKIWLLLSMDVGAILLIYLVTRQVLQWIRGG